MLPRRIEFAVTLSGKTLHCYGLQPKLLLCPSEKEEQETAKQAYCCFLILLFFFFNSLSYYQSSTTEDLLNTLDPEKV